jgi:hypothetical protein
VADFCEHGNESSGSVKVGEFPNHLRDYKLFKKDSFFSVVKLTW